MLKTKFLAQGVQKFYTKNNKNLTFDLGHDPMTLISKHGLDIMKIYLHAKNEVPSLGNSKVISQNDKRMTFDLDLTP